MNGVTFYLEYESARAKRKGESLNTVIAVYYDKSKFARGAYQSSGEWVRECASVLSTELRTHICGSSCSDGYLREKCKRISEAKAREIHPELLAYLEA
jgi:hypothetical protein